MVFAGFSNFNVLFISLALTWHFSIQAVAACPENDPEIPTYESMDLQQLSTKRNFYLNELRWFTGEEGVDSNEGFTRPFFSEYCDRQLTEERIPQCRQLARRFEIVTCRLHAIESYAETTYDMNNTCQRVIEEEQYTELIEDVDAANNASSCSEAEKRERSEQCLEDVGCVALSSLGGFLSAASDVARSFFDLPPANCFNSQNSCAVQAITAIYHSIVSLLGAIWDGLGWVGRQIADFFRDLFGVENATSDAQLAANQLDESQIDQFLANPVQFMKNMAKLIWEACLEFIKSDVFCQRWEGVPRMPGSRCVEPFTNLECASCGSLITGSCSIVGYIATEVVPTLLTGGAFAGVKWGATGAKALAGAIKASGSYRRISRAARALPGVTRFGQAVGAVSRIVVRGVARTRTVVRYVSNPALALVKSSYRSASTRLARVYARTGFQRARTLATRIRNTSVVQLVARVNSAHARLHRWAFRAGETVVDNTIGSATLRFSQKAVAARRAIRMSESVSEFRELNRALNIGQDNAGFIVVRGAARTATRRPLFFDVENSILKHLNDVVFQDKGLGDAVNNYFFQRFMDRLRGTYVTPGSSYQFGQLASRLENTYADYKSLRLQFVLNETDNAAAYEAMLSQIYAETITDFVEEMGRSGMVRFSDGLIGQAGAPETWFLAGTGEDAISANMAARAARKVANERPWELSMLRYSDTVDDLHATIRRTEETRQALSEIDEIVSKGIMVAASEGGPKILHRDAIAILRKTKMGDFDDLPSFRDAVRTQMGRIFNANLDDAAIDGLARYFQEVDAMSPPMFSPGRTPIDMSQGTHGMASVDFAGIGVENAREAMVAMASAEMSGTHAQGVSNTLAAIETRVDSVTTRMNGAKQAFREAVETAPSGNGPVQFSGDDGMFFPASALTQDSKGRLVHAMAQTDPSQFRATFVESVLQDGTAIPPTNRSQLVVAAEDMEKRIRKAITGRGPDLIDPDEARGIMIAVDFKPSNLDGSGSMGLILGGDISTQQRAIIEAALAQSLREGQVAGSISLASP